jgi:phage protein D/phage baseplate assembly protein gpV
MTSLAQLPVVAVAIDGTAVDDHALATLTTTLVRHRTSQPGICELAFADPPPSLLAVAAGAGIRLDANGGVLFAGAIEEVELTAGPGPQRSLRWRACDALQRLRRSRPLRAFADASLATVASEILAAHGLGVAGDGGVRWPHLVQRGQDDLVFLTDLAERSGRGLTLRDATVHLIGSEGVGAAMRLELGAGLIEAHCTVRTGDTTVAAQGWDAGRAESMTGGSGGEILADRALADVAQAEALAGSYGQRRRAQVRHWRGIAEGDPRLAAGTRVELRGLGIGDGSGILHEVEHRIDAAGGFTSVFSTLPGPTGAPDRAEATLATVSAVDDPAGAGRVRVSLPACGGVDGGWLPVLAIAAGAGKGLMALPGVGDRVAVLWLDTLRSQGLVLGGLWGGGGPSDAGISGGAIRRYTLRSPDGRVLRLDDAGGEIHLEDGSGNRLAMSGSGIRLESGGKLELAAPGHAVVITGSSIDFKSG